MHYSTFFFDLDDTLYPRDSGLWNAIRERINMYLRERMGFPLEQVANVRERFFKEYGTTLRGLQANYQVDMDEYLAYVHDVPLALYLQPDPQLRAAIQALPARKYIFTNADTAHASRVLQAVGLQGLFDGIIDVHRMAPYCKPMPGSFTLALQAAGNPDPKACVMLDDQPRVTRAARQAGLYSVLVGGLQPGEDADAALPTLAGLPDLFNGRN